MDLKQEEIELFFGIAKFPCDKATIEFPLQGEFIEVELQNETGRIKFQSDINRANNIVSKITFQLRHLKTYRIRRLDLKGNHTNPSVPVPNEIFVGFEGYAFNREDHIHFYIDGYGDRWALPLDKFPEIGIKEDDDIYDKMLKFFRYCNVQNIELKLQKNLML